MEPSEDMTKMLVPFNNSRFGLSFEGSSQLYSLTISESGDGKLRMETEVQPYPYFMGDKAPSEEFDNFDELQKKLTEIFETFDSVKNLTIETKSLPFILTKDVKKSRVLIECVTIGILFGDGVQSLLSQIEPFYLREVHLDSGGGNSQIYEMPQVVLAEFLSVHGACSISEDQLLKLNARQLLIGDVSFPITNYIDKCVLEAGTKLSGFLFVSSNLSCSDMLNISTMSPDNKMFIATPIPGLSLKIEIGLCQNKKEFITGGMEYDWERIAPRYFRREYFETAAVLTLNIDVRTDKGWSIEVKRKCFSNHEYSFESGGEFQKKLDEIMEMTDVIDLMSVTVQRGTNNKILWRPRAKKLVISCLVLYGDDSATSVEDLLRQVDPSSCIDIMSRGNSELAHSAVLYDMPQIHNAYFVRIANPFLRDDQLLKMKGAFNCSASLFPAFLERFGGAHGNALTAAGINQFIKNYINTSIGKHTKFDLGKVARKLNRDEILEGLEIMNVIYYGEGAGWIIKTNHPEIVLEEIDTESASASGTSGENTELRPRRVAAGAVAPKTAAPVASHLS